MLDNAAWDIVGDQLQKEDFFRHAASADIHRHQQGWPRRTPRLTSVTVSEAIEDLPEAGGLAYLASSPTTRPPWPISRLTRRSFRDRAHLRQLMSLGHHCTRTALEPPGESL
ncbi:hypothetical protein ACPA9J_30020 [Pseudomonas aeruginosa]